jgi:hypothetical protein
VVGDERPAVGPRLTKGAQAGGRPRRFRPRGRSGRCRFAESRISRYSDYLSVLQRTARRAAGTGTGESARRPGRWQEPRADRTGGGPALASGGGPFRVRGRGRRGCLLPARGMTPGRPCSRGRTGRDEYHDIRFLCHSCSRPPPASPGRAPAGRVHSHVVAADPTFVGRRQQAGSSDCFCPSTSRLLERGRPALAPHGSHGDGACPGSARAWEPGDGWQAGRGRSRSECCRLLMTGAFHSAGGATAFPGARTRQAALERPRQPSGCRGGQRRPGGRPIGLEGGTKHEPARWLAGPL